MQGCRFSGMGGPAIGTFATLDASAARKHRIAGALTAERGPLRHRKVLRMREARPSNVPSEGQEILPARACGCFGFSRPRTVISGLAGGVVAPRPQ